MRVWMWLLKLVGELPAVLAVQEALAQQGLSFSRPARSLPDLLSGLAARVPGLLAGGGAEGIAFLDVDDTVRELRREAGPALDRLASSAQSLASRSRELAAEARDRAREKAQDYVDATGRHVAEKPVQSLLLGVAAGALIGALLASRRRR